MKKTVSPPFIGLKPGANKIPEHKRALFKLGIPVLTAAMALGGCNQKPKMPSASTLTVAQVRVQTIQATRQPALEEVVGTVQARLRATIEARLAGRIEQMPVTLGQSVKAGDVLAKLDVSEIQAKLDQAKASREQAERDFKRISALLQQQAVTQGEFDAAEARYHVAQGAVAETESMLGYSTILAPFDGVITSKPADIGDLAMPGRPLLQMENPSDLRFLAEVPDDISGHVRSGAELGVLIGSGTNLIHGRVIEIAPAADPINRTVEVKVDLPTSANLRSGQFGRLLVPLDETTTLQVPASAVIQRGQMELVFVAKDQKAQLRLAKTGRHSGDKVQLLSGVSAGEQIVVEGAEQLTDGQPIEVK